MGTSKWLITDSKRESRENAEKAIIKASWFPNLKKDMSTQVKGVYWFLCRINKNKYTLRHISIMKPQKLYRAKPNQNKTHKTCQNMKSYQREIKTQLPTHECQLNWNKTSHWQPKVTEHSGNNLQSAKEE